MFIPWSRWSHLIQCQKANFSVFQLQLFGPNKSVMVLYVTPIFRNETKTKNKNTLRLFGLFRGSYYPAPLENHNQVVSKEARKQRVRVPPAVCAKIPAAILSPNTDLRRARCSADPRGAESIIGAGWVKVVQFCWPKKKFSKSKNPIFGVFSGANYCS